MILLTGGGGYIGSHLSVQLLNQGHDIFIIDNLSNCYLNIFDKISKLTNESSSKFKYLIADILDKNDSNKIEDVFKNNNIECVIHLAGLKSVGESMKDPLKYYNTNINLAINILNYMKKYGRKNFIFSSSATIYGLPEELPLKETSSRNPVNAYGKSKLMIEDILIDLAKQDQLNTIILRYFNPIGCHPSGIIGDCPVSSKDTPPNNLMPYIIEILKGKRESLNIFGNDYDTIDGTGVRDYIHIEDLANAHVLACERMIYNKLEKEYEVYNLGLGKGYSVLEIMDNIYNVTGIKIKYKIVERREGDIAKNYASSERANNKLCWYPKYNINDMCLHSYKFSEND